MKVQALISTYIAGTYRNGPTLNIEGVTIKPGDVFDVPDDFVVNRNVLRVITPPPGGLVRYVKLQEVVPPPVEVVVEQVEAIDMGQQSAEAAETAAPGADAGKTPPVAPGAAAAAPADPVLSQPAVMNPPVQGRAPASPTPAPASARAAATQPKTPK